VFDHFWPKATPRQYVQRRARLGVEQLETRALLSGSSPIAPTTDALVATPFATAHETAAPSAKPQPFGTNGSAPYSPSQITTAYGFNQISFTVNGQQVKGDGTGQIIAIVDAYDDPNIASDLHVFDQTFGLADPTLIKATPGGLPTTNSGWALETALDVEWAHAIAPKATILLVEAKTNSWSDLFTAIDYARNYTGVSVVSMSFGSTEFSSEASYDSHFTTPTGHTNVSFVASSGDGGAGASWPSISTNVLSVGGTSLTLTTSNTWASESAWSSSGGGISAYETEPSWQKGVESSGKRDNPDVAYDANPNTGVYVYNTEGGSGWYTVGGTSAGAPQWAALIAIADQGRAAASLPALANTQSLVYSLPSTDFHDITSGSNGYAATTGYDLATGLGSPIANKVVGDLLKVAAQTSSTSSTSSGSTTTSGGKHHTATDSTQDTAAAQTTQQPILAATIASSKGTTNGLVVDPTLATTPTFSLVGSDSLAKGFSTLDGSGWQRMNESAWGYRSGLVVSSDLAATMYRSGGSEGSLGSGSAVLLNAPDADAVLADATFAAWQDGDTEAE
jgi:subtilase family serine protease